MWYAALRKGWVTSAHLKFSLISYFCAALGSQFKVTLVVLGEDVLTALLRGHEGSLKHCS